MALTLPSWGSCDGVHLKHGHYQSEAEAPYGLEVVGEELGATAVWGTQQLDLYPEKKSYDGVFGIWYGKGPRGDRCSDVFKHANMAGTARHGGVIAIAGDDHIAKSPTAAHQSDHVFKAASFPVFFPTTVQDILDMVLHAFALSRYSGLWSGMKTIQEIVESGATVDVSPDRVKILMPEDFEMPAGGLHIRWPDPPLEQGARMMDHKRMLKSLNDEARLARTFALFVPGWLTYRFNVLASERGLAPLATPELDLADFGASTQSWSGRAA